MQFLPALLLAAAAATAAPARTVSDPVLVRAVIDGDTIDVTSVGRVRLLGIDAPEIGHGFDTPAPFGREARERLRSLVLHRWVRIEQDGRSIDPYNRRLAYVLREDGVFVNAAIVRDGLARVTARERLVRLPELKRAEAEAKSFRRGMWGATPQIEAAPATGYTASSARRSSRVRSIKPNRSKSKKSPARARKPRKPRQ